MLYAGIAILMFMGVVFMLRNMVVKIVSTKRKTDSKKIRLAWTTAVIGGIATSALFYYIMDKVVGGLGAAGFIVIFTPIVFAGTMLVVLAVSAILNRRKL